MTGFSLNCFFADLPAKKYESKEEAMTDFKELLEEKITSPKTLWYVIF